MLEKLKLTSRKKSQSEEEYFEQNELLEEMEAMQNELDYQNIENIPSRQSRHMKPKKQKKVKDKNIKKIKFKKIKTKNTKDEITSDIALQDNIQNDELNEKPKISLKEKLKQKPKKTQKRKKTKIIKKDRVSIDIGSKYIKIVEGMYDGKVVSIKNLATIPTPENSYLDGDITDSLSLKNTLISTINRAGITTKEVIYTMESKSIISREVELPSVIEKDIKQMIEFQIEEYFPVNLEEYVIQSKIVEEIDTETKKESKISVSILPKVMCEEYLNLTQSLALKPIALDMNDNSIYKLLSESLRLSEDEEDLSNRTIATLDIGYSDTNVVIIENGIFRFSRLVEGGGKDIDRNISQRINISGDELERMKLNIGSILNQEQEDLESGQANTQLDIMRTVIQDSLSELCEEVERIFRYHTGRSSRNKIDQVYIYGATSKMIDIEKYIERTLNIGTVKLDKLNNVRLVKKYRDADIMQYANAIGAIMRM